MMYCSYTTRSNVSLGILSSVQNLSQPREAITDVATQLHEWNMGALAAEHSLRETRCEKDSALFSHCDT